MRRSGLVPLSLVAAIAMAGCNDTTTPAGPLDLSGNYTLSSVQVSGKVVPNSSGTLQLTGATYDRTLVLNGQLQPEDEGTYLLTGTNTWSQNSTTTGTSAIGTFAFVNNVLTITITAPSQMVFEWTKTGTP